MKHLLHKKYKPLFSSKSRYFVVSGSRASGKSFGVSMYLLALTFEENQVILFSRYTMVSAEISVIPEFTEKIELLGLEDMFEVTAKEIINKTTGSKIIFRGLKTGSKIQTANLKSIAGLSTFVLDEAEELVDEKIFDKIANSIRTKNVKNRIILIFNPTIKSHWLYTRFFLNNGVEPGSNIVKGNHTYIHTTYDDVRKHLSDDFLEEADGLKKTNYKKWLNIFQGAFREKAEGVIFNNWKLKEFPKEYMEDSEFGLDFGYTDATALVRCHIDTDEKILYLKEEIYQTGLAPTALTNLIKSKIPDNSLIIADSAKPDLIKELKNNGLNVKGAKKIKIVEGINIMLDYKIYVDPSSKNLIDEMNCYTWDPNYNSGERPIDAYNHLQDSARYYCVYRNASPNRTTFDLF